MYKPGLTYFFFQLSIFVHISLAQTGTSDPLGGTLVIAVPTQTGLVVCSDKRLYNETTGAYRDDFVKIKQVGRNALFVATHTTGFLNPATGKMDIDVYEITSKYISSAGFSPNRTFWDGLKKEIRDQLLQYFSKREYSTWPATDTANNDLLFNLVFYTVEGEKVRSYSMRVLYEKAPTPVIFIPDVSSEEVRTPKLSGKGRDVMTYLARNPSVGREPAILKFDQSYFNVGKTTVSDAVEFARRLFTLTNSALPQAQVSSSYDCAMLSYGAGFQWIRDTPSRPAAVKGS
jgi:hypothetical protein